MPLSLSTTDFFAFTNQGTAPCNNNLCKRIKAFVMDSCSLTRHGAVVALSRCTDVDLVGQTRDPSRMMEAVREPDLNVILLGGTRRGVDPEMVMDIKKARANLAVMIYGGENNEECVHACVRAGATGYLGTLPNDRTLAEAVRCVCAGKCFFDPEAQACLASRQGRKELTSREVQMLQFISEGQSNKEMSSLLGISVDTVKFHVSNLITKLDARDRTHAIVKAIQRGIVALPVQ
jgi:two-component system NarL family response regulator